MDSIPYHLWIKDNEACGDSSHLLVDDLDMTLNLEFINGPNIGITSDKHQVFILCPNTKFQVGLYDLTTTGYVIQEQ